MAWQHQQPGGIMAAAGGMAQPALAAKSWRRPVMAKAAREENIESGSRGRVL